MITFRTVSDSLDEALFFQVDGREAGYITQRREGRVEVFFADMLDAPAGVTLERSTAPGSQGVYVVGITSLDDAIALVRRAYTVNSGGTTSASTDFPVVFPTLWPATSFAPFPLSCPGPGRPSGPPFLGTLPACHPSPRGTPNDPIHRQETARSRVLGTGRP